MARQEFGFELINQPSIRFMNKCHIEIVLETPVSMHTRRLQQSGLGYSCLLMPLFALTDRYETPSVIQKKLFQQMRGLFMWIRFTTCFSRLLLNQNKCLSGVSMVKSNFQRLQRRQKPIAQIHLRRMAAGIVSSIFVFNRIGALILNTLRNFLYSLNKLVKSNVQ